MIKKDDVGSGRPDSSRSGNGPSFEEVGILEAGGKAKRTPARRGLRTSRLDHSPLFVPLGSIRRAGCAGRVGARPAQPALREGGTRKRERSGLRDQAERASDRGGRSSREASGQDRAIGSAVETFLQGDGGSTPLALASASHCGAFEGADPPGTSPEQGTGLTCGGACVNRSRSLPDSSVRVVSQERVSPSVGRSTAWHPSAMAGRAPAQAQIAPRRARATRRHPSGRRARRKVDRLLIPGWRATK